MKFARIDLSKTQYVLLKNFQLIVDPDPVELENLYNQYCVHKKFKSVMPLFPEEYTDPKSDVLGYYDRGQLVAFSLMHKYNKHNVEALQFAWDYKKPRLALGIKSLQNECAYYKALGYHYLYLGGADEYKSQIDGFEILGPRT